MKKIIIIFLMLLAGIGLYYYPTVSSTLNVATGFSAKNICSGYFISGFNADDIVEEALLPIDDAFNHVNYDIDEKTKSVTTDIFGLFERLAIFRDGLGCTLLVPGQSSLATKITPLETATSELIPWPAGLAEVENNDPSINYDLLNQAIDQAFSETEVSGKRNVKAIGIVYKGKLIAERYAEGVDSKTPLLSWSIAKSITNLQIGLLVKSQKLALYEPATVPLWNNSEDPRSKITLDQLMRMSSGLEFNETYGIDTDVSRMLSVENNAGAFAADKPLQFAPDTNWSYSSGTTNILTGIIKRAIGGDFQNYYQYAQKELFQPLDINSAIMETDASDTFIGSSYLYASARDWAKLGQLMLQNGQWNGEQLLPENWVDYSTTPTKTSDDNQYGAQFWLNNDPNSTNKKRTWPDVPEDAYYMGGYQGQYVVTVPSKELVVVRFGFTKPGTGRGINELISNTIKAISTN